MFLTRCLLNFLKDTAVKRLRGFLCRTSATLLLVLTVLANPAFASDVPPTVVVHIFWAKGCPHCEKALDFLSRQQKADPSLDIRQREIRSDAVQRQKFFELARREGIKNPGVPLIVIGDQVSTGYYDDATTGQQILGRIDSCRRLGCPDSVDAAFPSSPEAPRNAGNVSNSPLPAALNVPLIGEVTLSELSLPALTILLAAIDGFNPCAMWTLVFLIGLLLGLRDRVRMWLLGSVFILGSAVVYFLFLTAWLNALLALGDVLWLRRVIAFVALMGGAYYLKRFFATDGDSCKVTAPASRRRVLDQLRNLASEPRLWLALIGILALAFVVNLIELVCSAGIPAIYTQLLAMHSLPSEQYYGYLLLYIVIFMLDDVVVFVVAMTTLRLAGIGTRYVRTSNLLGGIILLLIGLAMLFRPEWLAFG